MRASLKKEIVDEIQTYVSSIVPDGEKEAGHRHWHQLISRRETAAARRCSIS